jgi:aminoglycoside phosphotransferase (APT) family kinase protein
MSEPVAEERRQERLVAALRDAGVRWGEVTDCRLLGGGTFSSVFRVGTVDGAGLVVKLAPAPDRPVLRYERGILATEAWYLRTARERTSVPVPTVLAVSPPGGSGLGDHLVTSECPGTPWEELRKHVDAAGRTRLREELGRHMAALHAVTGTDGFGLPALPFGPLRPVWRDAFLEMLDAVLDDAGRFAVSLPRSADEIRKILDARSDVLDEVTTPRLVHWDLWDGNILAEPGPRGPRVTALIDAERAFWGDPVADFVSLGLLHDITRDEAFLSGYRAAGGPVTFDAAARERLALYRAYLYLVMWVEARPRNFDAGHLAWLERDVFTPLGRMLGSWSRGEGPLEHHWSRG